MRTVAGQKTPSDILTTSAKTETLLRRNHSFNMMATRDGAFKIVSIFMGCAGCVFSSRRASSCAFECCVRWYDQHVPMFPCQCFARVLPRTR